MTGKQANAAQLFEMFKSGCCLGKILTGEMSGFVDMGFKGVELHAKKRFIHAGHLLPECSQWWFGA